MSRFADVPDDQRRTLRVPPVADPQRILCSNDYLGLSRDPRLIRAAERALREEGVGSGASRLVSGTSPAVLALEAEVAAWKGTEAALVFNSGYQANVSLLPALIDSADTWILADRLCHASLLDGARLSGARLSRFRHNNLDHLAEKLAQVRRRWAGPVWVVTESVFSMDGDRAPLRPLVALAREHGAEILVDEAHATGLFGPRRCGWLAEQGVTEDVTLIMGTFSKALGSFGAYVAGRQDVIQALIQRARGLIYSTALPPSVIAANRAAVRLLQVDPTPTDKLWGRVAWFRPQLSALLAETGLPPLPDDHASPIFPIILGDNARALYVAEALETAGWFCRAIRPPTVPENTARVRITLNASQQDNMLTLFLRSLSVLLSDIR